LLIPAILARALTEPTEKLLAEHGPAMPMPILKDLLAADCPRRQSTSWYTQAQQESGVVSPDLPAMAVAWETREARFLGGRVYDKCSPYFPQLPALFGVSVPK
jgi:hypothetical protein